MRPGYGLAILVLVFRGALYGEEDELPRRKYCGNHIYPQITCYKGANYRFAMRKAIHFQSKLMPARERDLNA
jgi:hypothetical protein